MAARNPKWAQDELILALDLYFRHHPSSIRQDHAQITELSSLLNRLPIHTERPDAARFRNPNGVYMKLCNFLRFDPTYPGKGLTSGGRAEAEYGRNLRTTGLAFVHLPRPFAPSEAACRPDRPPKKCQKKMRQRRDDFWQGCTGFESATED